jgi:hypothetical protein
VAEASKKEEATAQWAPDPTDGTGGGGRGRGWAGPGRAGGADTAVQTGAAAADCKIFGGKSFVR